MTDFPAEILKQHANETTRHGCEGAYQRAVGDFVSRYVLANVGDLVETLQRYANAPDVPQYLDELTALTLSLDHAAAATEWADRADRDELLSVVDALDIDVPTSGRPGEDATDQATETLRRAVLDALADDADLPETLCEEVGEDPHEIEPLEFWAVDSWLAARLETAGEIVQELCGLHVWGRATSGQAILLDDVICRIYNAFHGDAWKTEPARTAHDQRLRDFGEWTLRVLAEQEDWNGETCATIAGQSLSIRGVGTDDRGLFTYKAPGEESEA
jgi:hypothetical protein